MNNFKKLDPLKTLIKVYLKILRSYGLNLNKGETFKNFSYRVCEKYPAKSNQIIKISNTYNFYRFNDETSSKNKMKIFLTLLSLEYKVIIHIICTQKSKRKIKIP